MTNKYRPESIHLSACRYDKTFYHLCAVDQIGMVEKIHDRAGVVGNNSHFLTDFESASEVFDNSMLLRQAGQHTSTTNYFAIPLEYVTAMSPFVQRQRLAAGIDYGAVF